MKEIIDIPDHLYKLLKDFPSDSNETTIENVLIKAVENGTPIPDNATVCDIEQIRAEIDGIEINGQVDEHTMFIRTGEQVKKIALDIIDKHCGKEKE